MISKEKRREYYENWKRKKLEKDGTTYDPKYWENHKRMCLELSGSTYSQIRYLQIKEKHKEYITKYIKNNPEKFKEYRKNYYLTHKEDFKRRNEKIKQLKDEKEKGN